MKIAVRRKRDRRAGPRARLRATSWVDAGTWLVAALIAVGLWLLVNIGERTSERTLRVRLEPENLPAGIVVVNPIPEYAEVRVSGSGLILSSIDEKSLHTTLDLSGTRPGVLTYSLDPKNFELPRKVEVSRVTPSQVTFHLDSVIKRSLPIRLERTGEVGPGLRLKEIALIPEKTDVSGPRSRVEGLKALLTTPFDLRQLGPGTQQVELPLIQPGGLVQLKTPEIRVRTVVEPLVVERVIRKVKLEVRNGDMRFRPRPDSITLVVRGPEQQVDGLELSSGAAYVDAEGLEGDGPHHVEPRVTLPPGIDLVRAEPAEVVLEAAGEDSGRDIDGRGRGATEKKT